MWQVCQNVCRNKARLEAVLFWPTTDAEGYAWNINSPFYRFGVLGEDGSTRKISTDIVETEFGIANWT